MKNLEFGKVYNNLTIENYIKTKWGNQFDENQINQIRLGLEANVDVSIYANENYDCRQMEEIRLGLEDNLDVSNYLDFELDWDEMQAIRLELKKEKQKNNFNLKKSEVVESVENVTNKKISFIEKRKDLIFDLKKGLS